MNSHYPFNEVQKLLASAQSVLLAAGKPSNTDQVAAALALFLSLKKADKQVSVVSPEEMRVEFSRLVGVDKIRNQLQKQDLILAFPIEKVEKISSSPDEAEGKLNIVVQLKPDMAPIKKEEIVFSSGGGIPDMIFTLGTKTLQDLEQIYQKNENLFKQKPVVNIDSYPQNSQYGQIKLLNPTASSCSEIVAGMIKSLNLPVDGDIAANLLMGLRQATQGFQSPRTTPEAFEAAAFCLRSGAKTNQFRPPRDLGSSMPSPDWLEPKIYKGSTLV